MGEEINPIAYPISIVISERNDKPCLELRKVSTDTEIIKAIISCAFHGRPIIVQPTFNDKVKAIGSLLEKGIIYKGADGQYYFTL